MKTYAYKQDKFDINKIEVVGSPVITEDGVASGFSSENYITKTLPVSLTNNDEIVIEGDIPANTATQAQAVFNISNTNKSNQLMLFINNNYFVFRYNLEYDIVCQLPYNKTYSYQYKTIIKHKTVELLIKSEKDENFTSTGVKSYSGDFNVNILKFGVTNTNVSPFLSELPLSTYKIFLNGKLVYSPTKPITFLERRKEGFDKSKFEVVGSPTITEDGVYSSLQPPITNYIKVFDSLPIGKNIRVEYEGIVGQITDGKSTGNTGVCVFREHSVVQKPFFAHFIDCGTVLKSQNCIWYNSQTEISRNMQGYYRSIKGDNYKVVFTFDSTKVNFELFINGVSKITDYQNISDLEITSLDFYIGSPNFVSRQHSTTVDLKTILIKINNKEIFNGQNDKYYALIR